MLRPSKMLPADIDILYNAQRQGRRISGINHRSYFVMKRIDLKDVDSLTYSYVSREHSASIEVHIDSLTGPVISTVNYSPTTGNTPAEIKAPVSDPGGKHDLYFVFIKNEAPNKNLASINWIRFEGGKEIIEKNKKVVKRFSTANPAKEIPVQTKPYQQKPAQQKPATAPKASSELIPE